MWANIGIRMPVLPGLGQTWMLGYLQVWFVGIRCPLWGTWAWMSNGLYSSVSD